MIWERPPDSDVSAHYGITYANGLLYTQGYAHKRAIAVSPATGGFLWRYSEAEDGYADIAYPPPVADGMVFVSTSTVDGGGYVAAFPAKGCESGCRAIWRAPLPGEAYGQPAVAAGRVFVPVAGPRAGDPGFLAVLDEFTGRPLWTWRGPEGVNGVSVAGDVVYVVAQQANDSGTGQGVYAFAAAGCGAPTCSPLTKVTLSGAASLLPPAVAGGTVVMTGSGVWGLRPTTRSASPVSVTAIRGTDRALRYRRSTASKWTNLGGRLSSAPAVVAHRTGPQFIGEGSNHLLYARTTSRGWDRLSSSVCRKPAAAIAGDRVYVACVGSDNALRTATGTVRDGRLTSIGSFKSLGGPASAGGAVAIVNGVPHYARTGSNRRVYLRTTTSAWRGLPLTCAGRVALARGGGATLAACRDSAGVLRWIRDVGAGFGPVVAAGGKTVNGGVGLAVDRVGRATVYVQATDRAVYRLVMGGEAARWQRLGAAATYGPAATQIRP